MPQCAPSLLACAVMLAPAIAHAEPDGDNATEAATTGSVIVGSVIDSNARVPLSGAEIVLTAATEAERTTTTNASGLYRFTDLPPAEYTVHARAGKASAAKTIDLASHSRQRVSFSLDPLVTEQRPVMLFSGDHDDAVTTPRCVGKGCRRWYRKWRRHLRRKARREARRG